MENTGLDRIISRILGDAQAEADEIVSGARAQAAQMVADAESRAEDKCIEIAEKAREDAMLIEHIAQSGAELNDRNSRLAARQKAINDVLDDAHERLCALPDEQYFTVLIQIARRCVQRDKGEIVLSKRDKMRMPRDFMAKLNDRIAGKFAKLTLADDTLDTDDGGFVLRYGSGGSKYGCIEENCTFSALIAEQREQLSDRLSKLLFDK